MNRRALTLFELLVAVCAILVLIGTFAIYANRVLKAAKEQALQNELVNIRMAIEHYRITNAKLPQSLDELLNEQLTSADFNSKITQQVFLKAFRTDKEGFLLDPFLKRYGYDPGKGAVYSRTQSYETW